LPGAPALPATPAQTCESNKNKAAGKYDYCRQKAEAGFALTGDDARRTTSLQKCLDQYNAKWPLLESKATAAGGACPSVGDQVAIQGVTDVYTTIIATALAGGTLQDCPADLATCEGDLSTCNGNLTACQASQQHLPATGQTTCWDSSGTVIPCAGTGQDGDTLGGAPPTYVDNGDGTITDVNTGLMWEKQSQDGSIHDVFNTYTWGDAFTVHAAGLNSTAFAGHNDWRVPNANEVLSIMQYEGTSPPVAPAFNTACTYCGFPGCDPTCTVVSTCSCTRLSDYWSSTSYALGPSTAWHMHFDPASPAIAEPSNKSLLSFVRAVRGGLVVGSATTSTTTTSTTTTTATTLRFVDDGDGTITDNQTKLVWEKKVPGSSTDTTTFPVDCPHCVDDVYSWSNAASEWISQINGYSATGASQGGLGGHSDWRLPTQDELTSLLLAPYPCGGASPCIDPVLLPNSANDYCSETTVSTQPATVWVVNFFNLGSVGTRVKSSGTCGAVRAVRGGS
jgi:hypothetical protein